MYRDCSGISSLVIKCFGITNTSIQNFAIRISSVKTVPKYLQKLKVFFNKFNIDISSLLMSPLREIVICQIYYENLVISSKIHLFAPLLNMRRCTVCFYIPRQKLLASASWSSEIQIISSTKQSKHFLSIFLLLSSSELVNAFKVTESVFIFA